LLTPPAPDRPILGRRDAARVVGLLSSASGLGVSARLCMDQLAASGFTVSPSDVAPLFGNSDGIAFPSRPDGPAFDAAISLYHLNPPMLLPAIARAGLRTYYRTYNVGYWAWELEALPADWVAAIAYVDAIMAPSEFCRAAVARSTDKPVCVVPHPADPDLPLPPRQRGENAPFTVLAMLNFGSSFERKNPLAALRAFKLAFGADPTARLIFKTSGGHRYPRELADLRAQAGDMSNVEVIDEVWSAQKLFQLYRNVDAYLSLHRSEGYGLTIAEAMLMECPVMVTAWSGNMDFCAKDTAFLVKYTLVDFKDDDPSYAQVKQARWAEPSADDAARVLRMLRAEPELGRRKAHAARRALLEYTRTNSYKRAVTALIGS
jgi:glycosyltransferase involved in cell wall biosynthesis